jgi:hypothetical protein
MTGAGDVVSPLVAVHCGLFIHPVLAGEAMGSWDPTTLQWRGKHGSD